MGEEELSTVDVGSAVGEVVCCVEEEVVRGEKMNFVERMVVGVTMRFGLQKE